MRWTASTNTYQYPPCSNYIYYDNNGSTGRLCPAINKNAYINAILAWNLSQSEYIWRAAVSAGAVPALIALLFSRQLLVETPRYTAHIKKDYQQAITDLASQGTVLYCTVLNEYTVLYICQYFSVLSFPVIFWSLSVSCLFILSVLPVIALYLSINILNIVVYLSVSLSAYSI